MVNKYETNTKVSNLDWSPFFQIGDDALKVSQSCAISFSTTQHDVQKSCKHIFCLFISYQLDIACYLPKVNSGIIRNPW